MDQYEQLNELGSGSFGHVYKIRRKSDGKILVWKELNYGVMSEKEKSMLVSEVNILRELKHPNIVRYYDRIINRDTSKIYIVMEYCENGDLASLLKSHKRSGKYLEESKVWNIFFQVLLAIHECHTRPAKILHRDIKPANIFIDKSSTVKLGDFGLARVLGENSHFAYTNVGTPFYMSPEQVKEMAYNEKSDMWSLGCLLYEMCALSPPFEATNQIALAMRIRAGRYNHIPSNYSEELQRTINSLLQLDPERRSNVDAVLKVPEISVRMHDRRVSSQKRQIKAKEDELKQREDDVKAKEDSLRQKEAELNQREKAIIEKERILMERMQGNNNLATRKPEIVLADPSALLEKPNTFLNTEELPPPPPLPVPVPTMAAAAATTTTATTTTTTTTVPSMGMIPLNKPAADDTYLCVPVAPKKSKAQIQRRRSAEPLLQRVPLGALDDNVDIPSASVLTLEDAGVPMKQATTTATTTLSSNAEVMANITRQLEARRARVAAAIAGKDENNNMMINPFNAR